VCRNNEQSGKCKTKLKYNVGDKSHSVHKLILHCLYKVQYIINLTSIWHFDLCYCHNIKGSGQQESTSLYTESSNSPKTARSDHASFSNCLFIDTIYDRLIRLPLQLLKSKSHLSRTDSTSLLTFSFEIMV
jgi:hypothetical protein